jgi:hypothetical protein
MTRDKILQIIQEETAYQEGMLFEGMTYAPQQGYRNNQLLEVYDSNGKRLMTEEVIDDVQGILDYAGFIPGIGDLFDAVNALIYLFRKKWILGGLSLVAVIPIVGSVLATPFKALHKLVGSTLGNVFGKITSNGNAASNILLNLLNTGSKEVRGFIKTIYTKIAKYSSEINNFLDTLLPKFDGMVRSASFGWFALPTAFMKSGGAVVKQLKDFFSGLAKGSAYKTSKAVVKSDVKGEIKNMLTPQEKETYTKAYNTKKVDKKSYPTVDDFLIAQAKLKGKKEKFTQLQLWSSGPNVEKLQKYLGLKVDGKFQEGTELAVKKWQKKNGLTQDGVVGPATWAKMT